MNELDGRVAADRSSRRSFLGLSASGAAAAVLTACSGSDTAATPATITSTSTAVPVADPAVLPDSGEARDEVTMIDGSPRFEPSDERFMWTDARILMVTTDVDAAAAASFLPPGLEPTSPARSTFFVAHYPETNFGSVYNEAAILIHATDRAGSAWHCPWMVVDEDTALIYGREFLGFPKKLAGIHLDETEDLVVGSAVRRGQEILRIEADPASLADEAGPVWSERLVNAHGSVIGGMRLLEIPIWPEEVTARRVGEATVTLGDTDRDPYGRLLGGRGEAILATVSFAEFTPDAAVPGEVLPVEWAFEQSLVRAR